MKKTKKICYKLLALILVCVITYSVNSAEVVHAAGISKDRAEQMYVYVLKKWLEQGVYVTVNNDIQNYVTNTKKRPTERIPLSTIFARDDGYYTIEDLNGDGIPECAIGSGVG